MMPKTHRPFPADYAGVRPEALEWYSWQRAGTTGSGLPEPTLFHVRRAGNGDLPTLCGRKQPYEHEVNSDRCAPATMSVHRALTCPACERRLSLLRAEAL